MAIAYYADVHVPFAISGELKRRGVDVLTSQVDGTRESSDEELLQRATELGRVLVTQDEDLLIIANEWLAQGRPFAGVVYAHQLRVSIGGCIRDLELIGKGANPEDLRIA